MNGSFDLGEYFIAISSPHFLTWAISILHPPRRKFRSELLYQANLVPTRPGNEANIKLAQQYILCMCMYHTIVSTWTGLVMIA